MTLASVLLTSITVASFLKNPDVPILTIQREENYDFFF
jgi:hypothetical protein